MKLNISIVDYFCDLTDPRADRGKNHNLLDMIVVALTATICGSNSWVDVERFGKSKLAWFQKFLQLEEGIPSHDTFGRVFRMLDSEELLGCLQRWLDAFCKNMKGQTVAIDGKTLRRSFDDASGKAALHLVSAWASDLHVSLGQVAVDDKSNEITAIPALLKQLEIDGAVVTLDAMHCQKNTAKAIRAKNADYVITVKKNQKQLYKSLDNLFLEHTESNFKDRNVRRHTTKEKSRGRLETRDYTIAPVPAELKDKWKDVQSVGMVFRTRENLSTKEITHELRYFLSSLPPRVRAFAKHVRGHWGIENSCNWTLDVTFAEDSSRIRKGNGQEIAAIFRRMALTLLKQDNTIKENVRGKRLRAGWDEQVLEGIFSNFQAA